ncbi:hypothetical protein [Clostridium botulinum]|uniref:hypothetical protein n=1 Tax=Clostridium botulinum TaxID=1491 RepID=UPI0004D54C1A|nr:hypothetical protein [Clostridium botulinum]KEI00055.1 membrane protein [Clostridium botulinum C/D str. BKT75002]KEI05914.1 membrane protein [Clostridium botulinum C/D str. BKT2873]QPW62211.1 hypothetical protein IG390_14525 [Clostridium botulinum]
MFSEMKKFYKNTAIVISFALALVFAIGMPILFIYDYTSYDYSVGREVVIKGVKGINYKKEQIKKVSGILDTDKLNKALDFYKSQPKGAAAYFKMQDKYPRIYFFLKDAYAPYGRGNTFDINNIPNANDFYNRNIEKVKEKINLFYKKDISTSEEKELLNRASNISKPYNVEFLGQWPILIKSLLFVYIFIILSGILISNQLFSFEKENNMDIILNAAGRKKLVSIGLKKVFAMITYLTLEFIICTTIPISIILGIFGTSGFKSQIQTLPNFFTTIYNWSIGKMIIYHCIIALISVLSIALIGALMNSILQKTYASLIVSSLLVIPPMFLKNNPLLSANLHRYLQVQPINGISLFAYIDNLSIYKIGSFKVLALCVIIVISMICLLIGAIFSPILFAKRINKNA